MFFVQFYNDVEKLQTKKKKKQCTFVPNTLELSKKNSCIAYLNDLNK